MDTVCKQLQNSKIYVFAVNVFLLITKCIGLPFTAVLCSCFLLCLIYTDSVIQWRPPPKNKIKKTLIGSAAL